MAPRKPKEDIKKSNPKLSTDKVAKRGARGYLTKRDGSLNVEPKTAAENALVETNRTQSPLLQLPPEIRNSIWKYVLGGNEYRSTTLTRRVNGRRRTRSALWPRHKVPNAMAILRVCRQIYSEAASMPILFNRIIISRGSDTSALRVLTKYQLGLVDSLCFEEIAGAIPYTDQPFFTKTLAESLTSLKNIQLHVFNRRALLDAACKPTSEELEAALAERFAPRLQAMNVEIELQWKNWAWLPYFRSL